MAKYRCRICKKYFSTPSGLTQHANAVHRGKRTVSQPTGHTLQRSQPSQPIQKNQSMMQICGVCRLQGHLFRQHW